MALQQPILRAILLLVGLVILTIQASTTGTIAIEETTGFGWLSLDPRLNLTDLLVHNIRSEDTTVVRALEILSRVEPTSCGVENSARLLNACVGIDNDTGAAIQKDLESLQVLYSIRMALCETTEGGAQIPQSCMHIMSSACDGSEQDACLKADVAAASSVRACLRNLQKEHFFWTSYSNHRGQATTLCEASRSGLITQQMFHDYQDMFQSLHDASKVLSTQREMAEKWIQKAFTRAQEMDSKYLQRLEEMSYIYQQQLDLVKASAASFTELTEGASYMVNTTREQGQAFVVEFSAMLQGVNGNIGTFKDNMARMQTGAAVQLTQAVDSITGQLGPFSEVVANVIRGMSSIDFTEINMAMSTTSDNFQSFSREIAEVQQQQIETAQQHQALAGQLLLEQLEISTVSARTAADIHFISDNFREFSAPLKIFAKLYAHFRIVYLWTFLTEFFVLVTLLSLAAVSSLMFSRHDIAGFLLGTYGYVMMIKALRHAPGSASVWTSIKSNFEILICSVPLFLFCAMIWYGVREYRKHDHATIPVVNQTPIRRTKSARKHDKHRSIRASTAPPSL